MAGGILDTRKAMEDIGNRIERILRTSITPDFRNEEFVAEFVYKLTGRYSDTFRNDAKETLGKALNGDFGKEVQESALDFIEQSIKQSPEIMKTVIGQGPQTIKTVSGPILEVLGEALSLKYGDEASEKTMDIVNFGFMLHPDTISSKNMQALAIAAISFKYGELAQDTMMKFLGKALGDNLEHIMCNATRVIEQALNNEYGETAKYNAMNVMWNAMGGAHGEKEVITACVILDTALRSDSDKDASKNALHIVADGLEGKHGEKVQTVMAAFIGTMLQSGTPPKPVMEEVAKALNGEYGEKVANNIGISVSRVLKEKGPHPGVGLLLNTLAGYIMTHGEDEKGGVSQLVCFLSKAEKSASRDVKNAAAEGVIPVAFTRWALKNAKPTPGEYNQMCQDTASFLLACSRREGGIALGARELVREARVAKLRVNGKG